MVAATMERPSIEQDRRTHLTIALVVLTSAVLVLLRLGSMPVGASTDDAYYVEMARSLAEGRGPVIHLHDETGSWPPDVFPPGFPLLLAPLAFGIPSPEFEIAVRGVKVASTLFGVCLLLLAAYQSAAGVEVRVDRRKIEKIHRWGALTLKRRAVLATDVKDLWIQKGSGSSRATYSLICQGVPGGFELLGGMRSRETIERLCRQIMLAAAIRPSGTH